MTQTEKSSRKVISGIGWSNPLTHDYRVDQAAHVHVFSVVDDTLTELVQGVDYTVSNIGLDAGYVVTITNAGAWAPDEWVLDARPEIDQASNLSVGGQFGTAFEAAIDKLTRRVQRVYDLANRGLKTSILTPVTTDFLLPVAVAGALIGWNADATALENKTALDSTMSAAELRAFASVAPKVSSLASLKALDTTLETTAIYDGSIWDFKEGDYTARIAVDTTGGIFAKADAVAASSGAWCRRFETHSARFYGASASASRSVNSAACQAAVNVAQAVVGQLFLPELYPTDTPISISNNIVVEGVSPFTSGFTNNAGNAINLAPSTSIANNNDWYGLRHFSALSTGGATSIGVNFTSTGSEYLARFKMEGMACTGNTYGANFDSTGSSVGIFLTRIIDNFFTGGTTCLLVKDGGDSITIEGNTCNGAGAGIQVLALKTGARQLVVRNNNTSGLQECIFIRDVTEPDVSGNWAETPYYLGSYAGASGAVVWLVNCPGAYAARNTVQPLTTQAGTVVPGGPFVPAPHAIGIAGTADGVTVDGNKIFKGSTDHIWVAAGTVTGTIVRNTNRYDSARTITDAGTGTIIEPDFALPVYRNNIVTFSTTAQFASTDIAESTNAGTGNGPYREVYRNKTGGAAANDGIGGHLWYMNNSVGVKTNLGYITMTVLDPVSGTEDGQFNIARMVAGSMVVAVTFGQEFAFSTGGTFAGDIRPLVNDAAALGNAAKQWSDLFLATGAVTNYGAGNYLVTHAAGQLTFSGKVLAADSMGYVTGGGGTVVQATSKATGVTLNKPSGQITMNAAALAAGAKVSFVVTNSKVAATDNIIVGVASGGTANAYRAAVTAIAAGSFTITVENITAGSLSESPVVNFGLLTGSAN